MLYKDKLPAVVSYTFKVGRIQQMLYRDKLPAFVSYTFKVGAYNNCCTRTGAMVWQSDMPLTGRVCPVWCDMAEAGVRSMAFGGVKAG